LRREDAPLRIIELHGNAKAVKGGDLNLCHPFLEADGWGRVGEIRSG